jgi:predicted ATPase
VICHSSAARTLWLLGYPDQGLAQSQKAVTLAQQVVHPFSLGYALIGPAVLHQLRREGRAAQECAEAAISLAKEQGFPFWRAQGAILCGWALAQQGQVQAGITQITQGIMDYGSTGAALSRPHYLALLADTHSIMGQPEAGLMLITEALTLTDTTGARWYECECYRLKGELLLQLSSDNQAEAETCFQQAITVAQNQQTKSLELRASTSLARLWQQQGKQAEARALLAPVYGWFTEGFDTADLQDTKALLEALA